MCVDGKVVFLGKLGAAAQHVGRAALRRKRRDRPVQGAAGAMTSELVLDIGELVGARAWLVPEHLLHVGWQLVALVHHGNGRDVPDHRREHDAQSRVAICLDHHVGLFVGERNQPQHVLHGGDAAAQAFQRAYQSARAHLLVAAVCSHRQRVEQPEFQRQLFEQSAAQRVVGMVMRVDQPRDHQPPRRVDDFRSAVRRKIGADRDDGVVFDQDVGDGGLMDVTVVIVDLPAADQRSFCRHLRSGARRGDERTKRD